MRSTTDERTWRATSWLPTATAATADTAATIHRAVTWKSTARRVPSLTIWLVSWNTSSPPGSERTAAIVSSTLVPGARRTAAIVATRPMPG